MNYITMYECDTVNGEGIRVSLFTAGCSHACEGCFSPETWNYKAGQPFTQKTLEKLISTLSDDWYDGLTLLGGDPLADKNFDQVLEICKEVKKKYPEKSIWCYTGYTLEEVKSCPKKSILELVDVLVDGKFEKDKCDKTLMWRGSRNQRILRRGIDF